FVGRLARELSSIGDVKIMRVGDYRHEAGAAPSLTNKQKEALSVALINGYYAWPRHVGLVQLADAAHISRRSMQERLRRAEAKLFPHTLKKYLGWGQKG
ncbi:MAG: helix-turn-helix domain-containing protein, partial [Candidatus Marsarchaeota archaeon]|nr:helix-turn-helix domain-containing protein [Candidatus Marsarchaeota archaeon]